MQTYFHTVPTERTHVHTVPTERTHVHIVPTKWTYVHVVGVNVMNSSYCLNMSLCNNHQNNETDISFYNILLNACAKSTCSTLTSPLKSLDQPSVISPVLSYSCPVNYPTQFVHLTKIKVNRIDTSTGGS